MADSTVKLEIEIGDLEIQFEGPTDFARKDLLRLIRGLAEILSELDDDLESDDEDEEEEIAEEEAEDKEGATESGKDKA